MAACTSSQIIHGNDCVGEDCAQVVRNIRTVTIPCTKNTYKQYTVKVPRQVTQQVPRTVMYTDYESRSKQVPYTVNRSERRYRMEKQTYQVPVDKYFRKTVMETREKQVPVPYYVNVPETKYRTVTENIPVQKTRVEMQNVVKTVYDSQTRTRCVPETKIVRKQIPVYRVVARPAPPCPNDHDCDNKENEAIASFAAADTNNDGVISFEEFTEARAKGNLSEIANAQPKYVN